MPVVLKKSAGEKVGLLLISHREIDLFKWLLSLSQTGAFVRKNYKIIVHIGGYIKKFHIPDWCNHVLTSPSNLGLVSGDVSKIIDLCSRDLLPLRDVAELEVNRIYDCIYIANNSWLKRGRDYLEFCESHPDLKAAFILTTSNSDDRVKFDVNLAEDCRRFSRKNKSFSFFDATLLPDGAFKYSRAEILSMLSRSRTYLHFCRKEGESRSMGEAMLSGCIVYHHDDLIGGAKDLNLIFELRKFNNMEILYHELIELRKSNTEVHIKIANLFKDYTSQKFLQFHELLRYYSLDNNEIDRLLKVDLSMLLPGHVHQNFIKISREKNSDVKCYDDLASFLEFIGFRGGFLVRLLLFVGFVGKLSSGRLKLWIKKIAYFLRFSLFRV